MQGILIHCHGLVMPTLRRLLSFINQRFCLPFCMVGPLPTPKLTNLPSSDFTNEPPISSLINIRPAPHLYALVPSVFLCRVANSCAWWLVRIAGPYFSPLSLSLSSPLPPLSLPLQLSPPISLHISLSPPTTLSPSTSPTSSPYVSPSPATFPYASPSPATFPYSSPPPALSPALPFSLFLS